MKEANNIGKNIKYNFGYSNFTFELWLILHKMDCFGSITHRKNYLNLINKAYGPTYLSLSEMKRENNFKEILKKIDINNILDAIKISESIMKHNEQIGYMLKEYKVIAIIKKISL